MFRKFVAGQLIAALSAGFLGAACLRDTYPSSAPTAPPPASEPHAGSTAKSPAERRESAHDLFISALTCFGAPIYTDAIGVELRDATATIDRSCAPLRRAAAETGADPEDDDAYVDAVRRAVDQRADDVPPAERGELLELFDKGLHAVREARSPWGLEPWQELAALGNKLSTPLLRDEAKALALLLEVDRRLRNEERKPGAARELVELEEKLVDQSGRLAASDLRTALDGCVQRLRTML